MHKLFSILFVVIFYTALTFGQATVSIPFSCTDGTTTIALAVGLDAAATNCIDPALGESDLPPFPPAGVFDIRFDLAPYGCPNLSTWFDYRPATFPFTGTIQHTLWWQTSAASIPINITYNLPTGQSFRITDQIGGSFLNLGPFTGSGTAVIPGTYTGIFPRAFLVMEYLNITPVELTSFTGSVVQDGVLLNWTTATELNNQGFEIERSFAAQSWEKIGFVPGFGTTTEPKSYSFLDENVPAGTYTYRLRQIDFDGSFNYSPEVMVEVVEALPSDFGLFQNYPNPFNPATTIQFQVPQTSDVSIVIYDMLGKEVKSLFNAQVQPGKYTVEWNGTNNTGMKVSSGSYIYRMTSGDFVDVKEMILLK